MIVTLQGLLQLNFLLRYLGDDSVFSFEGNEPPPGWQPNELKQLTGPPTMGPPPTMAPPMVPHIRSPNRRESPPRDSRERDRERERDSRSRSEKPRDRERERSHRRERSRSRSRRHRSRSRSPGHRSHKKKKSSRRHEDSDWISMRLIL